MILVRLLLSSRTKNENAGLTAKPSAEMIYGSTDSAEDTYRSNVHIADSKSTSVDDVFTISKADYCVYEVDAKETITRDLKDERNSRIYVDDR